MTGTRLGHYRIGRLHRGGGRREVDLAGDMKLGRPVDARAPLHPSTMITLERLAGLQLRRGRFQEAERLLLPAATALLAASQADAKRREALVGQLAALYDAWGQPASAARWRGRLAGAQPGPNR